MIGEILSVSGVVAGYGRHDVLHDVSFSLRQGEICGVIGPNGAGKTTLLRSMFGLLPLKAGRVQFEGLDITSLSVRDRLRLGIAYVPQERNVFANLTVLENLEIALSALSEGAADFDRRSQLAFSLFPRLRERANQLSGSMSGGEQRMVAIAIGLMTKPRLLMLDEPTTGLAPQVVHQLMNTIRTLNVEHGISAIVVEQNILSLVKIANSIELIKDGHARRYSGRPADIAQQNIWEYL
jgi:branched-chain amino acid transport system ATP-binding protein